VISPPNPPPATGGQGAIEALASAVVTAAKVRTLSLDGRKDTPETADKAVEQGGESQEVTKEGEKALDNNVKNGHDDSGNEEETEDIEEDSEDNIEEYTDEEFDEEFEDNMKEEEQANENEGTMAEVGEREENDTTATTTSGLPTSTPRPKTSAGRGGSFRRPTRKSTRKTTKELNGIGKGTYTRPIAPKPIILNGVNSQQQ
ncbi:hypothetical protein DFQ30_004439, partial [Apophysomyces sp. BC1015]